MTNDRSNVRRLFALSDLHVANRVVVERLGPEYAPARGLFERVALSEDYIEFLTLPAYELID